MKKTIFIVVLLFILMICSCAVYSFATEENTVEQVTSEETTETVTTDDEITDAISVEDDFLSTSETVVDAVAEVIENDGVEEITTGSVTDRIQTVKIEIIEGDYIGEEFTVEYTLSYDIQGKILASELEVGDKVTVELSEDTAGNVTATIQDVVIYKYMIGLFIILLVSILIVAGKKGIRLVISLLYTIVLIYFIMLKGVYDGNNAITSAVLTGILIIFGNIFIIDGISKKNLSASLGSIGGVAVATVIANIFKNLSKLSGTTEDSVQLSINMNTINFDFREVLIAGMLISALGVCIHVAKTIVNKLDIEKSKDPDITWKDLFRDGMKCGKENISTLLVTIIIAYFGLMLSTILLFMACDMGMLEILNKETIAEFVISALSVTIGIIYTVPITSIIYSFLNKDKTIYRKNSENRIEGKRSLKI